MQETTLQKLIYHIVNDGKKEASKYWPNTWVEAACKIMALRGIEIPKIIIKTEYKRRREEVYNESGVYFY